MKLREDYESSNLGCLRLNEERRPLTRWEIARIFYNLVKQAGLKDVRYSAYTFRHTSATQALRNGATLEHVKSLMGHSTLYMTMRYAATINNEDAVISHREWSLVDSLKLR